MAQANAKTKTPKAPKAKDTRPIPEFKDKDGALRKLRRKDFPATKDGRMAFCDYQVSRWTARKERYAKSSDPTAKLVNKLAKKRAELEKLEAELKAAGLA